MTGNALTIDIAGLVIQVVTPESGWLELLADRYAASLSSSTPSWQVLFERDLLPAGDAAQWIEHVGPVTRFRVDACSGCIDLAAKHAEVRVLDPAMMPAADSAGLSQDSPPARRTITERIVASAADRILSYVSMLALPRQQNGLLLHAVGVVLEGHGLCFFGPSGAGKTTIARLAAGRAEVLADENVIVRLGHDGPELLSTPFWGHSTPPDLIRRTNRCVPLHALYELAHAPAFGLTRLRHAGAVAALLGSEKVASERVESAAAWLAIAGALTDRTPVFRLEFLPSTALWDFLASVGNAEQARQLPSAAPDAGAGADP